MKSLLVFLPSRNRPERMYEAVQSFIDTTDGTHSEIRILVDKDDPQLEKYLEIFDKNVFKDRISYVVGEPDSYTNIVNREFKNDNNREFYCLTNDDIIFKTPEWDKLLSIDWAITTGHEPNMHEYHKERAVKGFPIISVIDGRICRELGWLQYPKLDQCCGDNVWHMFGVACKNLLYIKDVIYIHNHAVFGKVPMDEHYHKRLDNNYEEIVKDHKIYMNWAKYERMNDVKKVRGLIDRNNGKFKLRNTIKKGAK